MAANNTKLLILRSTYDEIEQLQPFVEELCQWANCNNAVYDRIRLSLSEAVNNAIVHGNKLKKDKDVTIKAVWEAETLSLSVSDEGSGFDAQAIPDPLKEDNLLKKNGRGIYLIRHYADQVNFSRHGSCIHMEFSLKNKASNS